MLMVSSEQEFVLLLDKWKKANAEVERSSSRVDLHPRRSSAVHGAQ